MQFFLDSADMTEIKNAAAMGLLDGLTTNPSLIAKTGRDFKSAAKEILHEVKGPVSLEVIATETAEMVREGEALAELGNNVVVKIPLIAAGLMAVRKLSSEGIKTNVTLCFSANQALLAAKAGATYISPFVGRLDDISAVGMDLIRDIGTIYRNYKFTTKILVASARNPLHVQDAALAGADICTMPWSVMLQLAKHPLTDLGLAKFLEDWKKVPQ